MRFNVEQQQQHYLPEKLAARWLAAGGWRIAGGDKLTVGEIKALNGIWHILVHVLRTYVHALKFRFSPNPTDLCEYGVQQWLLLHKIWPTRIRICLCCLFVPYVIVIFLQFQLQIYSFWIYVVCVSGVSSVHVLNWFLQINSFYTSEFHA